MVSALSIKSGCLITTEGSNAASRVRPQTSCIHGKCGVQGAGVGCGVQGARCGVQGAGCRVQGAGVGCGVHGAGCRA